MGEPVRALTSGPEEIFDMTIDDTPKSDIQALAEKLTGAAVKTIKAPALPNYRSEIRTYHLLLCEIVLDASTRSDNHDKDFIDEVLELDKDDPELDRVPSAFVKLDRALRSALEKTCKNHIDIKLEIEQYRKSLDLSNKMITARRILHIIYSSMMVDGSMFEVVTIKHLSELIWPGDDPRKVGPWLNHSAEIAKWIINLLWYMKGICFGMKFV